MQRLAFGSGFFGNIDVRQGVTINGTTHDLVGASSRASGSTAVDPDTRLLLRDHRGQRPDRRQRRGLLPLREPDHARRSTASPSPSRAWSTSSSSPTPTPTACSRAPPCAPSRSGSEAEGCVADDDTGALYISEENVALWRYSAEPAGGTTRTAVDVLTSAGGHLINDIEGVTLVDQPDGKGFIIVSAQGTSDPTTSYFSVYRREGANEFVKTFRVSDGVNSDDCDHTDGVTATTADLGAAYPRGMFVCQDNNNDAPVRSATRT